MAMNIDRLDIDQLLSLLSFLLLCLWSACMLIRPGLSIASTDTTEETWRIIRSRDRMQLLLLSQLQSSNGTVRYTSRPLLDCVFSQELPCLGCSFSADRPLGCFNSHNK